MFSCITQCDKCGGGTGQVSPCVCPITMKPLALTTPEARAALEADKAKTRVDFVSKFVAEKIQTETWPDNDIARLLMMAELINAWENRNKQR